MWQLLSRRKPEGEDLEASTSVEKSAATGIAQDGEKVSEEDMAGLRKRLGRLSPSEYAADPERPKLETYERSKLEKEHSKLCSPALQPSGKSRLPEAKREKLRNYDDAIQPHTDEGGDAYYIGDAYTPINPVFAAEWRLPNPGPYLTYVKQIALTWTHLEYLAHWMEVTCAPPKWKLLRNPKQQKQRDARAGRCKACFVDYTNGSAKRSRVIEDCTEFAAELQIKTPETESRQARLIIVEDLSRDLVETLGAMYDVDPLFFLSHIGDYLFHNTRDRWVELPNLDIDARRMSHFTLGYLRARYFEDEAAFADAEYQSGKFNVLRRLDSDRSRTRFMEGLLDLKGASVALSRAKTSLWVKPKKTEDEPITAILLVDPTVTAEHSHPLWGGYRPFTATPTMEMVKSGQTDAPERVTLFDDIVYWSSRMSAEDIIHVQKEPKYIALPMYKLVIADWMAVVKYMTTMLGKIEWEFEGPHWGEKPSDVDSLLKKLSPWRRNVGYYQSMISEAIARLFPPEIRAPLHGSPSADTNPLPMFMLPRGATDRGVFSLYTDFQNVKRQMDEIQLRIQSIENTATNAINIEESRRAVKQNKNLARLTFLATIFIPLNFTSSFLSISPEFSTAYQTIWLFFAIGIPLTISALLIVDLSHPGGKGFVRGKWRQLKKKFESKDKPVKESPTRPPSAARATTIPWEGGEGGFRQRTRELTSKWGSR